MKKLLPRRVLALPLVFTGFVAAAVYAAPQTLEFDYDVLGRLTFVKDNVNGNRDYDYDKAGNRTQMTVGASSDGTDPGQNTVTAPAAPANLRNYTNHYPGVYTADWDVTENADYYILRLRSSLGSQDQQLTTNTHTYSEGASGLEAERVRACNAYGCSADVYF